MLSAKSNPHPGVVATVGLLAFTTLFLFFVVPARADDSVQKGDSTRVMEAFERQPQSDQEKLNRPMTIQKKHLVMFLLGVPLFILLLVTGALGIAMGVYGKQVFVWHMISAGLTITLAFVHAITGIVWFYPF